METILDKWLSDKKYFTRTKDTPIPSHLLYNGYKGGKLYIPRTKEYEFLGQYAAEMARGTKLYFVETRPKTFKFMIDVDISDDHYWSVEEIAKLTVIIQKTVYAFFETNQVVICCTSPVKIKNDGTHTGIHLIWPNLFVTSDTALCIRRGIIQKLKEANEFKMAKSWEDIIDETIFTRNGYRMVGSDKMKVIKENGTERKIPEDRPLGLLFVMDSEGQFSDVYYERLKNDTKALILETSIRYVIDTYLNQGMNINKIPIWLEEDPLQKKAGPRSNQGNVVSTKEHHILEQFIKRNMPKYYHGVIKSVVRYPKEGTYPPALLIKTTSRYCMNIGRDHNSCGVYFYATPDGITQRCLCSCNKMDGRKNGLCMDYVSGEYKFTEETRTILFPETEINLFEAEEKTNKKGAYMHIPMTNKTKMKKELFECEKMFKSIME